MQISLADISNHIFGLDGPWGWPGGRALPRILKFRTCVFSFALVSVRATNGREERAHKLGQAKLASALEQEHKGSTVQNIFILKGALN